MLRLLIVSRRAGERLDKADQARQRCAQFVAGIGNEVRAHPLGAANAGQIVKRQNGHGPVERRSAQRHQACRKVSFDVAVQRELDDPVLALSDGRVGGVEQGRVTQDTD